MAVLAIIFPLGLVLALGTIAAMFRSHGSKMVAALRMEPYPARTLSSPCPPSGEPRLVYRMHAARTIGREPELRAA